MTDRLKGRTIAITGAAQGIGRAIAEACAREGAALYLLELDGAGATQTATDLTAAHPDGRFASPEEIANAAVFMVSDDCPVMTATCLTIDGGLSVRQHG